MQTEFYDYYLYRANLTSTLFLEASTPVLSLRHLNYLCKYRQSLQAFSLIFVLVPVLLGFPAPKLIRYPDYRALELTRVLFSSKDEKYSSELEF